MKWLAIDFENDLADVTNSGFIASKRNLASELCATFLTIYQIDTP